MKISNDHLAATCSVIDTADLARVQGGARFSPGDGRVGRSNSAAPGPVAGQPWLVCPDGTSPNNLHVEGEFQVTTPAVSGTARGTVDNFWCSPVPR